jgi:hypothetical protein
MLTWSFISSSDVPAEDGVTTHLCIFQPVMKAPDIPSGTIDLRLDALRLLSTERLTDGHTLPVDTMMAGNRLGIQGIALGTEDGVNTEYVYSEENSAGTLRPHNFVASSTLLSGEVRVDATALPKFLIERFAYRCVKLNLYINEQRERRFHRTEVTAESMLGRLDRHCP